MKHPKILIYDIETAPLLGYVWSLWQNDVALNQLNKDWHVLSWAAKWVGDSTVMYADQSKAKDVTDDKKLLQGLWKLLNEADVVITHNGKKFDEKKLNARFVLNGMTPAGHYKHIDTCQIAKRKFGFTSNKLEYLANQLNVKYKKLTQRKFPGFELWSECLKGNKKAWEEMRIYNTRDVHALEEVYLRLAAWDTTVNFNLYHDDLKTVCNCGNDDFHKNGFHYTTVGKFQVYKCTECGHKTRSRKNLLSEHKRKSLRSPA